MNTNCCILMEMADELNKPYEALDGHSQILILPHNGPDPYDITPFDEKIADLKR